MKKLLLVLFLAVGSIAAVQAQEVKWLTLDQALAAQKKKPEQYIDLRIEGRVFYK